METLSQDIRFGVRMLAKRPAFTAIVVLVLAVGIGANTALFSVFKTVVLSPLPFPQPKQLMFVNSTMKGQENLISGPDYVDWREQNRVFSAISAVQLNQRYTLTGSGSIKDWWKPMSLTEQQYAAKGLYGGMAVMDICVGEIQGDIMGVYLVYHSG